MNHKWKVLVTLAVALNCMLIIALLFRCILILFCLVFASLTTASSAKESTLQEQSRLARYELELVPNPGQSRVKSTQQQRKNSETFFPATALPEAILYEAHRAIFCSQPAEEEESKRKLCKNGFQWIDKEHRMGGILTASFAVIAFVPIEEGLGLSAVSRRLLMHEQMFDLKEKLIKNVTRMLTDKPNRQILLVGSGTGGGMAELAAWLLINRFGPTEIPSKNYSNQFKVVTWDEVPIFTIETSRRSPVLTLNHLCFMQRQRSTIGEESIFSSNGLDIVLEPGAVSKFTSTYREYGLFYAFYNAPFQVEVLKAPTSCAAAVSDELKYAFKDPSITCRVSEFVEGHRTFEIHCTHDNIQFLSFEANLTIAEETVTKDNNRSGKSEGKKKDKKKKKRHGKKKHRHRRRSDSSSSSSSSSSSCSSADASPSENVQQVSDWEGCLHQLFVGREQVRLLQPFAFDDSTGIITRKWHHFPIPALSGQIWRDEPITGCQVRPIDAAHEMFQLATDNLEYFYRLVQPNVMKFPDRLCNGMLLHVPLSEPLQNDFVARLATQYISERVVSNMVMVQGAPVNLFHLKNTDSFETLEVHRKIYETLIENS